MTPISLGDLAQSFQLRRESARLTTEIAQLTEALSSGRRTDLVQSTGGATAPLAEIERSLTRTESYAVTVSDLTLETDAVQNVIGSIRDMLSPVRDALLAAQDATQRGLLDRAVEDSQIAFASAIEKLNTSVLGRTVFSGTATDRLPLADAEIMLADIEAEVLLAGATTAADIEAVVDAWFAPGGGFDTIGYLGATEDRGPVFLSDTERSGAPPRADSTEVRALLASLAGVAISDRPALAVPRDEAVDLARSAALRVISADVGLVSISAEVGNTQGRLEAARTSLSSERDLLESARSEIISADPYETATRLQTAEAQLQMLYTITARQAQLSLTQYLR